MTFCVVISEGDITGPVEVLGPSMADINGGMGGVYVRSLGQEGKAAVKISLPDQGLSSEVVFDIRLGV